MHNTTTRPGNALQHLSKYWEIPRSPEKPYIWPKIASSIGSGKMNLNKNLQHHFLILIFF